MTDETTEEDKYAKILEAYYLLRTEHEHNHTVAMRGVRQLYPKEIGDVGPTVSHRLIEDFEKKVASKKKAAKKKPETEEKKDSERRPKLGL